MGEWLVCRCEEVAWGGVVFAPRGARSHLSHPSHLSHEAQPHMMQEVKCLTDGVVWSMLMPTW